MQVDQKTVGVLMSVPKKKKIPGEGEAFMNKVIPITHQDENAQKDSWVEHCGSDAHAAGLKSTEVRQVFGVMSLKQVPTKRATVTLNDAS